MVKKPPAMQVTQAQSPGQEDPLEEKMTTHSSILAWRGPGTEEPGGLWGHKKVGHDLLTQQWQLNTILQLKKIISLTKFKIRKKET